MALTATQAAGYLNETLEKLGNDYRIDTTSDTTLTEGFKAVGAFPPALKSNILDMQMLILVQRAYSSMFTESKNPTRRFWRDAVDYGGGIRETFLKLIEAEDGYWAEDFDGTDDDAVAESVAKDLVRFKKDDVINKIHPVNKKFRIKMSISDLEYAKVFTPDGYAAFIDRKYANFQESAEAHLMDLAISTLKDMISNKHIVVKSGYNLNTPNGVTSFVEALNTTSDGMATLSAAYNYDQVRTTTDPEDVYLVTTPEIFNRMKSRGYANAFNLQEYINKNKIIMLPAGTDLGTDDNGISIGAMLVDYRAVLLAVKYWEVMPFIVSNTDYRNTFLKVQLVAGYTEFFNAVAFATGGAGFFTGDEELVSVTIVSTGNLPEDKEFLVNGEYIGNYTVAGHVGGSSGNTVYQVPKGSFIELNDTTAMKVYGVALSATGSVGELWVSYGAGTGFYATTDITVEALV